MSEKKHPFFSMPISGGSGEQQEELLEDPNEDLTNVVNQFIGDDSESEEQGDTGSEKPLIPAADDQDFDKDPENPEDTADTSSDDDDLDGRSKYSIGALSFKEDGLIPAEWDVPKDLDKEGFNNLLIKAVTKRDEEAEAALIAEREAAAKTQLEEKGLTEERLNYIMHLESGGNPYVVQKYHQLQQLAKVELGTEERMLQMIRYVAGLENQDPDLVDAYIGGLTDTEKMAEAAKRYQAKLLPLAEKELEADKARVADEIAEQEKADKDYDESLVKIIREGFFGLKLPKQEQEELIDYTTKRSVATTIDTPKGKKRVMITPFEAFGQELQKNPAKNVLIAYRSMKGVEGLANAAHKAANDKFIDALIPTASRKEKPETKQPQMSRQTSDYLMKMDFSG